MGKQTVQLVSYYGTQQVAAPPAQLNDTEDRRRPINVKRTTQSLWSAEGSLDIFHRGGQMGQDAKSEGTSEFSFALVYRLVEYPYPYIHVLGLRLC